MELSEAKQPRGGGMNQFRIMGIARFAVAEARHGIDPLSEISAIGNDGKVILGPAHVETLSVMRDMMNSIIGQACACGRGVIIPRDTGVDTRHVSQFYARCSHPDCSRQCISLILRDPLRTEVGQDGIERSIPLGAPPFLLPHQRS